MNYFACRNNFEYLHRTNTIKQAKFSLSNTIIARVTLFGYFFFRWCTLPTTNVRQLNFTNVPGVPGAVIWV